MITPPLVQEPFQHPPRIGQEQFVFVVCQHGAETTLKAHWIEGSSPFRLAFSRPGLLTFKFVGPAGSPPPAPLPATLPEHWLARQTGLGLGQVRGEQAEKLVAEALAMAGSDWDAVHIYHRDQHLPGIQGFEPGGTPLTDEIGQIFQRLWPSNQISSPPIEADSAGQAQSSPAEQPLPEQPSLEQATLEAQAEPPATSKPAVRTPPLINQPCELGDRVLDVVLVEVNQWLIGHHTARLRHECWPGGAYPVGQPSEMISRAYLKMAEAVAWSVLPLQAGDDIVELGSAPGGACQRLLDLGLKVTGVDPAEMDPLLVKHERFDHWRSKTSGVRRKLFSKFRWLACDANVAPTYTLEMVEDIVQYPTSRFEGLLLTLKLSSYDLAEQMPSFVARIKSWGFERVVVRQLASNRRECLVVAQRGPGWKRPGRALLMQQTARANAEKRRLRTAKKRALLSDEEE